MKKRIYLIGRHSNRTPLAYESYKHLAMQYFEFVNLPELADILIFGFTVDLEPNIEIIKNCVIKNPEVKIVVLCEEPLWDTLWSGDFFSQRQSRVFKDYTLEFYYFNHHNSRIFEFNNIPYFVTTNNDYIARYQMLFSRNSRMTTKEIQNIWTQSSIDAAFFAEFRDGELYNKSFPEHDIYGLSNRRTKIAQEFKGDSVLRVGLGWGNETKRQALPDWHLDKLATLDRKCRLISAIENTHQRNYISEKIFDSYACLGIPVFIASEFHSINNLLSVDSYINLYGTDFLSSGLSAKLTLDAPFSIESYLKVQNDLFCLFNNENLTSEKNHLLSRLASQLEAI